MSRIHFKLLREIKPLISSENALRLEASLLSTFALLKAVDMSRCLTSAIKINSEGTNLLSIEDIEASLAMSPVLIRAPGTNLTRRQTLERAEYFLDLMESEVASIPTLFVKFMKWASRLIVCSLSLFDVMNMREYDHSNFILFLTQWAFMQELAKHDSSDVVKHYCDPKANTECQLISNRIARKPHQTRLFHLPDQQPARPAMATHGRLTSSSETGSQSTASPPISTPA